MATKATKTTARSALKTELSPVLKTIPTGEALADFHALCETWDLIPDDARDGIAAAVVEIVQAADRVGIKTLHQLITDQGALLTTLTGASNPTEAKPSIVAERQHTYRNLIVAMTASSSAANACSPDAAYHHATRLPARTTATRRPCTDDEIVLLRTAAALDSLRDCDAEPANIYALAEAGATPGKTTTISRDSFNDGEHPTVIRVPGSRRKGATGAHLPLDDFNTRLLGRRLQSAHARALTPTEPLTYRPRKNLPGSPEACASATGVLNRFMTKVGLANSDVTASSITKWRQATICHQRGADAAAQASGRKSPERTLISLRIRPQEHTDVQPAEPIDFMDY